MAELQEILQKTLVKVAEEQNYKDYEIFIKEFSTEGANYSSAVFNAKITSPNKSDLLLFAKVATMNETLRQQANGDEFYLKENYVYKDLVKIFNDIQDKYSVPTEDRYKFPKFYGSNLNRLEETFVLEDLAAQGYVMYDRFKPVTWEYASKAVEELAKFHALSIAFHNEKPDEFPRNDTKFNMLKIININLLKTTFVQMASMALNYVPENIKDRLKNFLDTFWTEESIDLLYAPTKWPILAHGDYRASNILFKRKGGKISSLIPVDYQTLRLASPSTDLLYFIYSGTDERFRKLHLKELLNHYYNTLAKFITIFNMDPEAVFSRKDFNEEYNSVKAYGLTTALFLLPIVLVDPANAPKMSDEAADFNRMSVTPSEAFTKRFLPIVNEYIKIGLL